MNDAITKLFAGLIYPESGCWIYDRAWRCRYPKIKAEGASYEVHRLAHELFIGPIPAGDDVHHTCEQTHCCNPDHLQALSCKEHYRLHKVKTHCRHGHEFTPQNTYIWSKRPDQKQCRLCLQRNGLAYQSRQTKLPDPRTLTTHCKRGHPFTSENTYRYHGHRSCKECVRFHKREFRARHKQPFTP